MRRWIAVLFLGLAGIVLAYFAADATARTRPTVPQAHVVVHYALDDYALLFDGRVIVGPCRPAGAFSTICRARVDGTEHHRYRVVITTTASNDYLVGAQTLR